MTADDFQRMAAMARRIDGLAHKLGESEVSAIMAAWHDQGRRRLARMTYRNQDGAWIVQRWALPGADGLVRLADLPED